MTSVVKSESTLQRTESMYRQKTLDVVTYGTEMSFGRLPSGNMSSPLGLYSTDLTLEILE